MGKRSGTLGLSGLLKNFDPETFSGGDNGIGERSLLQSIMEAIPGFVLVFDRNREPMFWNEKVEELSGYDEGTLRQMHFSDFVDLPNDDLVQTVLDERIRHRSEAIFCFDDNRVSVEVTLSPLYSFDRDVIGFIVIGNEPEGQLREKLQASRAFLRSLFNTLPDVLYFFDTDENMLEWNDRLTELTGYTDEEIRDMSPLDLAPDADEAKLIEAIDRVFENRDVQRVESELVTKSGDRIPFEFNGGPLLNHADEVIGLVGTGRDITERKEQEEALREKKLELKRMNEQLEDRVERRTEELEEFLHAVSHDLREPLRQIDHYAEFLQQDLENNQTMSKNVREDLDFLTDAAHRMQDQIKGLLRLSRIGDAELNVETVDPEVIVQDALRNLERELERENADVTIEDLPTVQADPDLLTDLYQNLISNALKYSGDNTPRIRFFGTRQNDSVTLAVEDNGIGMDPEQQETIFRPFRQLEQWDEQDGAGMGLSLCRRIINRHEGNIWVESEPGQGSTFKFTLPEGE